MDSPAYRSNNPIVLFSDESKSDIPLFYHVRASVLCPINHLSQVRERVVRLRQFIQNAGFSGLDGRSVRRLLEKDAAHAAELNDRLSLLFAPAGPILPVAVVVKGQLTVVPAPAGVPIDTDALHALGLDKVPQRLAHFIAYYHTLNRSMEWMAVTGSPYCIYILDQFARPECYYSRHIIRCVADMLLAGSTIPDSSTPQYAAWPVFVPEKREVMIQLAGTLSSLVLHEHLSPGGPAGKWLAALWSGLQPLPGCAECLTVVGA